MLAGLAAGAELAAGIGLFIGLAIRWFAIPLIATTLVAIFAAHWANGWLALANSFS